MLRSRQFGSYEILRKLGRGMTDVYLAFDPRAARHAVLKIVEESSDPLTQIVIEAERRGAALQRQLHDFDSRVVEIYEYGMAEGCFFVAMQYIEGRNVAEILRQEKRLHPLRAAEIAAEICGQLGRLHSYTAELDGQRRAVVHGDIKPSNIQIGLNDEVRLLDFGIAKAITFTHNLTHHNFGSPSYCSPERLRNAQVDHQADLWAVGVTLYEMLAGIPPYRADSTRKLEALIQSRRPPGALPSDCPPGLQAIVQKALAGDLHQRYVSALAFRGDLLSAIRNQPTAAEQERRAGWNINATIEKPLPDRTTIDRPRPPLEPRPRSADYRRRAAAALGLLGALLWGLLTGLLIFIPAGYFYRLRQESEPLRAHLDQSVRTLPQIESDWNLYQRLSAQGHWLGRFSPAAQATGPLRASYLAGANEIIERYRSSSDPILADFDWLKAEVCLRHALSLGPDDRVAQGQLALAGGYLALAHGDSEEARRRFKEAATDLPRSPDPHLALARVYAYSLHNLGEAAAEFHAVEALGGRLGPREMQQEADVYRYRAGRELAAARRLGRRRKTRAAKRRLLLLSQRDYARARKLYEPIRGFSGTDAALNNVDHAVEEAISLDEAPALKQAKNTRQKLAQDLDPPAKPAPPIKASIATATPAPTPVPAPSPVKPAPVRKKSAWKFWRWL